MSFSEPHTQLLAQATGATLLVGQHGPIRRVSIDTRSLRPGDAFFALSGPNFDGHDFLQAAQAAGAAQIIGRAGHPLLATLAAAPPHGVAVFAVADPQRALADFAAAWRRLWSGQLVGVTGSSGKTTTKQMTAAVLGAEAPTLATEGNLNNHLGVPLTLLRLRPAHRFAVIEMGMSAAGEIATLAAWARPHVGVVTSVGPAHLENFEDVAGIARAKGELLRALPPTGCAVLPSHIAQREALLAGCGAALFSVGVQLTDTLCVVEQAQDAQGLRAQIRCGSHTDQLHLRGFAAGYQLDNALLALAVGLHWGLPLEQSVAALAQMSPPPMRGERRLLADGAAAILDCYNANPQSMAAAAQAFVRAEPAGLLVLGDMLELGPTGPALHRQIGEGLAQVRAQIGADARLLTVGPLAEHIAQGALAQGWPAAQVATVAHAGAAAAWLKSHRGVGQAILLKASRGLRLERIYTELSSPQGPPAVGGSGEGFKP